MSRTAFWPKRSARAFITANTSGQWDQGPRMELTVWLMSWTGRAGLDPLGAFRRVRAGRVWVRACRIPAVPVRSESECWGGARASGLSDRQRAPDMAAVAADSTAWLPYGELHRVMAGSGGDVSQPWAELGETVSAIRAQLQQAMDEGSGKSLQFRAGPVELEFSIEVRKEGGAKAKVFVLPWSAEARGAVSADAVHRIKLTLQPVDVTGADARVHGSAQQRPS